MALSAVISDIELARQLAGAAGSMLSSLQSSSLEAGVDGQSLKTEGDSRSQALLSAALEANRPGDAVLSEEAVDDASRLVAQRVWIIDPLDGTREFSEGRRDWAVHVALWSRGSLAAGAVALPGVGRTLDSEPQPAAPDNLQTRPLRIAVSRSRPPALVGAVADAIGAELVPMGSAGYKVSAVVLGEVDAYLHAGGQFEWDSAAPVVVARSRGLHTSRIDGSELLYNQRTPYLPDLLVCRPSLAIQLLATIERIQQTDPREDRVLLT